MFPSKAAQKLRAKREKKEIKVSEKQARKALSPGFQSAHGPAARSVLDCLRELGQRFSALVTP